MFTTLPTFKIHQNPYFASYAGYKQTHMEINGTEHITFNGQSYVLTYYAWVLYSVQSFVGTPPLQKRYLNNTNSDYYHDTISAGPNLCLENMCHDGLKRPWKSYLESHVNQCQSSISLMATVADWFSPLRAETWNVFVSPRRAEFFPRTYPFKCTPVSAPIVPLFAQ